MNIMETLSEPNVMVRDLVINNRKMFLKNGLIEAGLASGFPELSKLQDEMLVWDEEGNVFLTPVVSGIWFEPVIVKHPNDPHYGSIIASLKETQAVRYNPDLAQQSSFGITKEYVYNNMLHFYRSDHADCAPFLSLSPFWLLVPEFRALLEKFPEGDFSALKSITEIIEPNTSKFKSKNLLKGAVTVEGEAFLPQPYRARIIKVPNYGLLV